MHMLNHPKLYVTTELEAQIIANTVGFFWKRVKKKMDMRSEVPSLLYLFEDSGFSTITISINITVCIAFLYSV